MQSTSLHSLEDLQGGIERYGALDYAFLSPIFDSISKQVRVCEKATAINVIWWCALFSVAIGK